MEGQEDLPLRAQTILFLLMALLIALGPGPLRAAEESGAKRERIAVWDLLPKGGLSADEAALISDRLRLEIVNLNLFDVFEREQMNSILQEQGFQQSGMCSESECLVQVGQLIGVRKIVGGTVGKIGSTYSINVKLLDVATGKILKPIMVDCRNCPVDEVMITSLGNVAAKLCDQAPASAAVAASTEAPRPQPRPRAAPRPTRWTVGAAGSLVNITLNRRQDWVSHSQAGCGVVGLRGKAWDARITLGMPTSLEGTWWFLNKTVRLGLRGQVGINALDEQITATRTDLVTPITLTYNPTFVVLSGGSLAFQWGLVELMAGGGSLVNNYNYSGNPTRGTTATGATILGGRLHVWRHLSLTYAAFFGAFERQFGTFAPWHVGFAGHQLGAEVHF